MKKTDCLYVVIPAYNEAENIEEAVKAWHRIVDRFGNEKSRLLVVNDGSKDNTGEVLEKLEKKYSKLKSITKPNGGHGATVLFGYRYALKKKADYVFQTDSDNQTNPDEFEDFWRLRDHYDAIFGNRTKRGDGEQRAFVEKTLCRILRHFFGVKIPDANAPFRLMTADYLSEFMPLMPKDYNLPNAILTACGAFFEKKILFIPISFENRSKGVNSINIKKITKIGLQAVKDFKSISKKAKEKRKQNN